MALILRSNRSVGLPHLLRAALICLTIAALLLPRMSAVLLEAVPGIRSAVICTGERLIVIKLDSSGQPVQIPQIEADVCTLSETDLLDRRGVNMWVTLARSFDFLFSVQRTKRVASDVYLERHLSRAPPVQA